MVLDPKNGYLDREIFIKRFYELEILEVFKKYIKKGDFVIDIGANIGHHSIFISYLVGENGKVDSFESVRKICNQILESIKINNIQNIQAMNFALGELDKKSYIHLDYDHMGGSSILERGLEIGKEEI